MPVKHCPRCDRELPASREACPDCGGNLAAAAEVRVSGRESVGKPLGSWYEAGVPTLFGVHSRAPEPLPQETVLKTVDEGDLDLAQTLAQLLRRQEIRCRVVVLEPPANSASAGITGIPNSSGWYAVRVAPAEAERARALWQEEMRHFAPLPDEAPTATLSEDRADPEDEDSPSSPNRPLRRRWLAAPPDPELARPAPAVIGAGPSSERWQSRGPLSAPDDRRATERVPWEEPGRDRFHPLGRSENGSEAASGPVAGRRPGGASRWLAILGGLLLAGWLGLHLLGLRLPFFGSSPASDFEDFLREGLPEALAAEEPPLPPAARQALDDGIESLAQGREDEAATAFGRGLDHAPHSPTLHSLLALVLASDESTPGWEVLEHARLAALRAPGIAAHRALYADSLVSWGLPAEGEAIARELVDVAPETSRDAYWMSRLFHDLHDYEALRTVTASGAAGSGDAWPNPFLQGEHLWALLHLGRWEEAEAVHRALQPDDPERPTLQLYDDAWRASRRPLEAVRRLMRRGMLIPYGLQDLEGVVSLADASRRGEEARAAVEAWLPQGAQTRDDWAIGIQWVEPGKRAELLDRHLASLDRESLDALAPGLVRLSLPVDGDEAVRRLLARRLARLPIHDILEAQRVDAAKFLPAAGEPYFTRLAAHRRHVEETPEHLLCALDVVDLLVEPRPAEALERLDGLGAGAPIGGSLGSGLDAALIEMDRRILRLEILVALGRAAEALDLASRLPLGAQGFLRTALDVEQTRAEAAFLAADDALLESQLALLRRSGEPTSEVPALFLRWSRQAAEGTPLTYRQDSAALLERHGRKALEEASSRSTSVAALLAVESSDPDAVAGAAGLPPGAQPTVELARLFARAAAKAPRNGPPSASLEAIAASPYPGSYGSFLARTILTRRDRP